MHAPTPLVPAGGDRTRAKHYAALVERVLMSEEGQLPPEGQQLDPSQCSSLPPSPPMSPALPSGPASGGRGAWALVGSLGVLFFCWMWLFVFAVPGHRPQHDVGKLLVMNASGSSASRCPTGWAAVVGHGPHGGARCFRVPRQLGTHYECATAICPGSSGADGKAYHATLATLGSAEESRRLFDSVGLTSWQDLWIGLYRTSGGGSVEAEKGRAGNDTQLPNWRWVAGAGGQGTSEDEPSTTGSWRAGQPDARFGREDCGYVSGTTGEWEDYGCDLREMRCLCELGASASPEYHTSMKVHAAEMGEVTSRQRVWVAMVIGAFFALPLFLSTPEGGGGAWGRAAGAWQGLCSLSARNVVMHLATPLFFWGFAPLVLHVGFGVWTAMQLGSWIGYAWMGCAGGFLLLVTLPRDKQWIYSVAGALVYFGIAAVSALHVHKTIIASAAAHTVTLEIAATVCVFMGFTVFNVHGGSATLAPVMSRGAKPNDLYQINYRYGTLTAKASGLALLITFMGPMYLQDPDFAMQHPSSPGIMITGIALLFFGFTHPWLGSMVGTWLLGDASNAHQRAMCSDAPLPSAERSLAEWKRSVSTQDAALMEGAAPTEKDALP
jgi:hypothetical protein